ncbi:MAG: hypothetical protein O2829_08720 [Bacteroidetes bacterium]|nr:hypothetical protein [Bacteroidota bacterium]
MGIDLQLLTHDYPVIFYPSFSKEVDDLKTSLNSKLNRNWEAIS